MVLPDAARDLRDLRPSQQRVAQSREGDARIRRPAVGSASPSDVLAERPLPLVVGVGGQHSFDDRIYAGLRLQRCEARCLGHNKRWPARSDERQAARAIRELHVELRAEPVDHAARSAGAGDHFALLFARLVDVRVLIAAAQLTVLHHQIGPRRAYR